MPRSILAYAGVNRLLEREPTVRFLSGRKPPPLQVGEDVTTNDRIANLCMAFAGALQFHAFRKVKSLGMTSLACTGNYRAMAESLVMGGADAKESVFDPIKSLSADPWLVFCRCMFQCAGPVWNRVLYDLDRMRYIAVDEFLEGEI